MSHRRSPEIINKSKERRKKMRRELRSDVNGITYAEFISTAAWNSVKPSLLKFSKYENVVEVPFSKIKRDIDSFYHELDIVGEDGRREIKIEMIDVPQIKCMVGYCEEFDFYIFTRFGIPGKG